MTIRVLTEAEIADQARARGSAAGAADSLAANTAQGVANNQAGAGAMNTASTMATAPAPTKPAEPFRSTAGDNVNDYINRTSATLGGDPGYTTEAGKLAAERTTNGLKTPDASSVNAQNTQDTAAARNSYLARMQSEEAIGQSGFGAGTAQADRIRTNSQAGVNAANQAGQNSVNAYLRNRTEDNLNRATELEKGQYNKGRDNLNDAIGADVRAYGRSETATDRGLAAAALTYSKSRDAVGDARYDAKTAYDQGRDAVGDTRYASETDYAHSRDAVGDTRYNQTYADSRTDKATDNAHWDTLNQQQQAQLAVENKAVADGKDDTAKRNLLAGLPDGPAKNAVMAGLADGSLTVQTALAKVMNPDGSIKEEYRGKTPGALGMEAEKEYAQQTVDLQDPTLKTSNPEEYLKRVNAEILAKRTAETGPVLDDALGRTVQTKLSSGAELSPEEKAYGVKAGLVNTYTAKDLPKGSNVGELKGQQVNIDGKVYTVIGGDRNITDKSHVWGVSDNHQDYTILDQGGKRSYVLADGTITNTEPKDTTK